MVGLIWHASTGTKKGDNVNMSYPFISLYHGWGNSKLCRNLCFNAHKYGSMSIQVISIVFHGIM